MRKTIPLFADNEKGRALEFWSKLWLKKDDLEKELETYKDLKPWGDHTVGELIRLKEVYPKQYKKYLKYKKDENYDRKNIISRIIYNISIFFRCCWRNIVKYSNGGTK